MKKISLIVLLAALTLSACKKGDTGPAGPPGPTGATGATGATGNANVKAGKAPITPANWTWDAATKSCNLTVNDVDITQNVVDYGTISVFASTTDGGWVALPYTSDLSPSVNLSIGVYYNLGLVKLSLSRSDGANDLTPFINFTLKIVAITGAQKMDNPKTNWKDYNQVMQVVGSQTVINAQ